MASRTSDSQPRRGKQRSLEIDPKATRPNNADLAEPSGVRNRLPTPLSNPVPAQIALPAPTPMPAQLPIGEPSHAPRRVLNGGMNAAQNAHTDWEQPAITAPNALRELKIQRAQPNLQPTLCILSSNVYAGVEVLVDRKLRIGRDPENDIRLPGDVSMSRHHAIITPTPDCLFVEDAGSTNGTLVNGTRVTRAPLNHNDRIRIGDTLFQVRYEPRRAMSQATPPPMNATLPRSHHGDMLRAWRRQRGLTQTELATQLGVSQRTISLWEQGSPISPENLRNLREKGGCDVL